TGEDVLITGTAEGTKTVDITGTGPTYDAAVSGMTTGGTLIVNIPAGSVTDSAGNPNSASTSTDNTVYYILEAQDAHQGPMEGVSGSYYITGTNPSDLYQKVGQTFTVGVDGQFDKFMALLTPTTYSSQDLLVEIYNTSEGVPVGPPIAGQTFNVGSLSVGPWHWVTFRFTIPVHLLAAHQYALVLDEVGEGSAQLRWVNSGTTDYDGGNGYVFSSIGALTSDFAFQTFRVVPPPGTATHFHVEGYTDPALTAVAHDFTVTARDDSDATITSYTGTVHFTSTDSAAVLPGDYTFTAGDAGAHTFSATLSTLGEQSITATDAENYLIAGIQSAITVVSTGENPVVSAWPAASAITHGQALSASSLSDGTASVTGSFAFTDDTIIPDAGTYSASVTFTPTDTRYNTAIGSVDVTV
ncbi:MAG: hypothetical protein P8X92_09300, partial [Dehalococcoidia bacterium]